MSWQAKSAVEQEIEAFQQRLAESVALHQDVLRSLVQDRLYRDWEALQQPLPPHYSLIHRVKSWIMQRIHSRRTRKRRKTQAGPRIIDATFVEVIDDTNGANQIEEEHR